MPLGCGGHSLTYNDDVLASLSRLAGTMGTKRWRKVSDVAQVVANYARCHPRVEEVRYPGLTCDPLFKMASHTLTSGFGPIIWYKAAGEWHAISCGDEDSRKAVMWLEHML